MAGVWVDSQLTRGEYGKDQIKAVTFEAFCCVRGKPLSKVLQKANTIDFGECWTGTDVDAKHWTECSVQRP